jgi:CBS domain-containing protein
MNLNSKEYLVENLVIDDEYGVIESNATIQDAAKKMKSLGVPDLVVEDAESKKVLGVIADFDIIQNVVAEGSDPGTASVLSAMYKIEPVRLKTTVQEAFERMQALQVNVVPVVEKDKLIGVCTIQDCWSYIPDKTVDSVGLIPIANTRTAEFWFASTCAILGFVLGILLPLIGAYGFFLGKQADLLSFFGFADIRGGIIEFELFEARGIDFLVPFANLIARNGVIWVFIIINGFIILILGILGLFALIYASFSDARSIRTGFLVRKIIPFLLILFMILEWILYAIAFGSAGPAVNVSIDSLGLTISILAMLLFLGAIYRDYVFRSKTIPTTEVKS